MSFPLTMSGFERTYRPPRSLRASIGDEVTAWELFQLEHDELAGPWASATLASVIAAVTAENADALGCTECADTGFYGVPSTEDPDLLLALVRRSGDQSHEVLTAGGWWEPWDLGSALEVLDVDTATDLAGAITAGASGLLRLYGSPRAFLPPADSVSATALRLISGDDTAAPQVFLGSDWKTFAVVAGGDPGAVLDLWRFRDGGTERWDEAGWTPDTEVWAMPDAPMVELTVSQLEDVLAQMQPAIVADAPLTVSPDPRAERLRIYWTTGKGGAKLRWTAPGSGDWHRCVRHLSKYMGLRARGYCANLHKRATSVWPGDRRNTGFRGSGATPRGSPEAALLASIRSRRMTGDTEGKPDMPATMLTDGVYTEVDDINDKLLQALAASAIPVAPPDEWFDDPKLTKPTTLTVSDDGRVFGHIAPWGVSHIGMAGSIPAPRNRSGKYAYFRTGQLRTASGKDVRVGQLTVAGGHASTRPGTTVEAAVKHYDDTASAVADIAVGEDEHGIWAAGALRPNVTPEQVRVMRASPPSGDWRTIGGNFELVAACHVNVQGFPIAAAGYSGGACTALVAAGARQMAELRLAEQADSALVARLGELETLVASLVASAPPVPADPPDAPQEPVEPAPVGGDDNPAAAATQEPQDEEPRFTAAEWERAGKIAKARDEIAAARRQALRDRVTAGAMPPQFAEKAKGKSTIKGTDSFPIGSVADLKKAIQAFGRSGDKPAAKKHIISQAYKLKRPDLIPDGWRGASK